MGAGGDEELEDAERAYRDELARAERSGAPPEERAKLRVGLGTALLARGRPADATKELERLVRERPGDARARLLYGTALLVEGKLEEAERQLARCPASETDGLSDLLSGIALDRQGKSEPALRAYRRYLERHRAPDIAERVRELEAALARGDDPAQERDDHGREETPRAPDAPQAPQAPELAGSWRVVSSRLFYDAGGGGHVNLGASRMLDIDADGAWAFGPSRGRWSVRPITAEDWKRWGVNPYGPTRKVVVDGWGGTGASGPIEESGGRVDFFWLIHRTGTEEGGAPGTIHAKFGRSHP